MSADWVAAIVAACALLVSICALSRQHDNADGQRKWEQDQVTRRESFEKRQQQEQNEWQASRDKEFRKFEAELRTPSAKSDIHFGSMKKGLREVATVTTRLVNTGQPTIFVGVPEILLPNGLRLVPPPSWLDFDSSLDFYTTKPLKDGLPQGSSIAAYWDRGWVENALRTKLPVRDSTIEIRARFTSEAGDEWISEDCLTITLE